MDKTEVDRIRTKRVQLSTLDATRVDADAHPEEVWIEHWAAGVCIKTELYLNGRRVDNPEAELDSMLTRATKNGDGRQQ